MASLLRSCLFVRLFTSELKKELQTVHQHLLRHQRLPDGVLPDILKTRYGEDYYQFTKSIYSYTAQGFTKMLQSDRHAWRVKTVDEQLMSTLRVEITVSRHR